MTLKQTLCFFIIAINLLFVNSTIAQQQSPPIAFKKIPKALYIWGASHERKVSVDNKIVSNRIALLKNAHQSRDRLLAFAKQQGITTFYLFVGSMQWNWKSFSQNQLPHEQAVYEFIAAANAENIAVQVIWYLNDDPNDLSNWQRGKALVSAVVNFNKKYSKLAKPARIAGIQSDQEPHHQQYKNTQPYVLYLKMLAEINAEIKKQNSNLINSVTIETKWLHELYTGKLKGKTTTAPYLQFLLQHIQDPVLMDYYTYETTHSQKSLKKYVSQFLQATTAANTHGVIALETGWASTYITNTFYSEIKQDVREYTTKFYDHVIDLNKTITQQSPTAGLALHSYTQYYFDLSGVEPLFDKESLKTAMIIHNSVKVDQRKKHYKHPIFLLKITRLDPKTLKPSKPKQTIKAYSGESYGGDPIISAYPAWMHCDAQNQCRFDPMLVTNKAGDEVCPKLTFEKKWSRNKSPKLHLKIHGEKTKIKCTITFN